MSSVGMQATLRGADRGVSPLVLHFLLAELALPRIRLLLWGCEV